MKLLLIYITAFVVSGWLFLAEHGGRRAYAPLQEGLLYSTSISSQTTLTDEVTEKILFKRTADDEYPTIAMSSTEHLPGKFIVRLTDSEDAKYRIVLPGTDICGAVDAAGRRSRPGKASGRSAKARERSAEQAKAELAAVTVQKKVPQDILNVNKIRDIVNASEKTYFFAIGAEKTLKDVTLKIKSVTPWQNRSIITAEVTNSAGKYFFISNISVTSGGLPLQADLFNEPFVQGNKTATIFILTRQLKNESVSVKLTESAGGKRNFDIPITLP